MSWKFLQKAVPGLWLHNELPDPIILPRNRLDFLPQWMVGLKELVRLEEIESAVELFDVPLPRLFFGCRQGGPPAQISRNQILGFVEDGFIEVIDK